MPLIPLNWLAEHTPLREGADAEQVAADLVSVGLEEESIQAGQVTGPLVVGRVLDLVKEPQKNGKTINWCRVDVGPEHNEDVDDPKDPQPGDEVPSRGIICGAHNFVPGDLVVVSLPGTVLPGPFEIAARKTYGHLSDGMICSGDELGLGPDPSGEDGIIVLGRGHAEGLDAEPGDDAIALLGLGEGVVEINVTPDRGYCFSMRGVAREYSHATGNTFTDPAGTVEVPESLPAGIPVQLSDDAPVRGQVGCTRFVAAEVHGVDPSAPTPTWMRRRLTLAGMRPISLIVDVTNYVMLDLGQPLHAYDAHQLVGPIVVRRAREGEKLRTLDAKRRDLDVEDLVIADQGGEDGNDRAIGIAGVMGGASTEVSERTTNVVIEAATFAPVGVARSARRHKLPSEASKRFERGVDPLLPPVAAQRAAELVAQYGGGEIQPYRTDVGEVAQPTPIAMTLDDPERVVGVPYSDQDVLGSLTEIGCAVTEEPVAHSDDPRPLTVTPPSWRPDLTIAEDLVEEVARLVGYDTIPSVLPMSHGGRGLSPAQKGRRAAATALAEDGLVEVTSYPFVGEGVFDTFGYASDDPRRNAVRLLNPLADDEPLMRTAVLQTLLPVAQRNIGRGEESVAVFEIASASRKGSGPVVVPPAAQRPSDEVLREMISAMPEQRRHLAAVLAGESSPASWWGPAQPWGWSDAIAVAQRAAAAVGATLEVRQARSAPLHPGRCAELWTTDGELVGHAGELHPKVVKAYSLPARASVLELDLDALIASAPAVVEAEPVSTFPLAKEDFAFVVDEETPASAVEAAMVVGIGDVLEQVRLFDVFTGEQIGQGRKSLAFSVRLRSQEGTLSAKEIGAARTRCIEAVESAVGGVLRA
jgi:phenylalanyl-tRNA synthetase beta chain